MTERVLVAMSGGVDSSVAALLLKRAGLDVVGVTLRLWPSIEASPAGSCCGLGGLASARLAADTLGIPHHLWDASRRFEEDVLRPAWEAYAAGQTPNPCIVCNAAVKFGLLCDRAAEMDATWVATGHYARLVAQTNAGGPLRLHRGRDRAKDQSYFLYALSEAQRLRVRFPLGELQKDEVRSLARDVGLACAERAESQDACLTAGEGGFAEALRLRFGAAARPGAIVDREGREVGQHAGCHLFTLGQRRGTGVAMGRRSYVSAIDADRARVTITDRAEDLLSEGFVATEILWHENARGGGEHACLAQIRYRSPAQAARVALTASGGARVRFESPVRAVTPGQAAVFYDGDRVLGGGRITETF